MARVDVVMPQMGESIAEGTLSKWLKKLGDPVKRDEPMFEISTDKVDAEIPAPQAGVLAEILVQEGQTVPVQTVVARLETDAAAVLSSPPASASPPPPPPPPAPPAPSPAVPQGGAAREPVSRPIVASAGTCRSTSGSAPGPPRWSARSPPSTTLISRRSKAPGWPDE
jgi:pyruvate dehydrogenase E2 component (dihydrolipoamide acetyltransferase)